MCLLAVICRSKGRYCRHRVGVKNQLHLHGEPLENTNFFVICRCCRSRLHFLKIKSRKYLVNKKIYIILTITYINRIGIHNITREIVECLSKLESKFDQV